ncbi:EFR1 family ferrodoxin [Clostridium sp.]|uniref:EFR1 family ferrodoxin n=1 Tax=Clostridium sp. TaxID=1506 RepID=UPI001A3FCE29|nr:EFR1 family ferrodoxin [Clostridium sp.]MBK5242873.1 EFR1 family ferrodoxin [Clostridium sp.]
MNTKIFYFTSTGNSLYVAKKIKDGLLGGDIISMSKALKIGAFNGEAEVIILVYPIHCFSLPIAAEKFISKLNISKDAYIAAVGVSGGGGAKDSFPHINQLLKGKGEISNYECIKYISNYTRVGRTPTEERALKAINENEDLLNKFIESIKNREVKKVSSNRGTVARIFHNTWKNTYKNKDKAFNVNEQCIGCEMCKKICPVDDIQMVEGKPKWLGKCTDCMACINICPKEAINIGKGTLKKNRYKNPYINVQELL